MVFNSPGYYFNSGVESYSTPLSAKAARLQISKVLPLLVVRVSLDHSVDGCCTVGEPYTNSRPSGL